MSAGFVDLVENDLRVVENEGMIPKALLGNNFVSDGHVCNTFCPVLQKLVDVGLKTF